MEKLDRLGWAAGMVGSCWGVRIGVRTTEPAILPELLPSLPPVWRAARGEEVEFLFSLKTAGESRPGVRPFHLAYNGPVRIARTPDLAEALEQLESGMHQAVAGGARDKWFVHAGAVAWRGQAILLPGATMSGKSTLVSALVQAGAEYLSDEFGVIDERGRVHPYPRRLALRSEDGLETVRRSAAELGGETARRPVPLGAVLFTGYRAGARWRPRELSAGEGVLRLLEFAVPARRRPRSTLSTLRRALEPALAVRSKRGDVESFGPELVQWLNDRVARKQVGDD